VFGARQTRCRRLGDPPSSTLLPDDVLRDYSLTQGPSNLVLGLFLLAKSATVKLATASSLPIFNLKPSRDYPPTVPQSAGKT
jgi:hypothetical protein